MTSAVDYICAFALSHPGSREHALYRSSTQTDYLHHSIAAGFALLQATDITMNEVINRTNTLYNYISTHINTHSLAQTYKCRAKSISYISSNKTLVLIFKNISEKTSKIRSIISGSIIEKMYNNCHFSPLISSGQKAFFMKYINT